MSTPTIADLLRFHTRALASDLLHAIAGRLGDIADEIAPFDRDGEPIVDEPASNRPVPQASSVNLMPSEARSLCSRVACGCAVHRAARGVN